MPQAPSSTIVLPTSIRSDAHSGDRIEQQDMGAGGPGAGDAADEDEADDRAQARRADGGDRRLSARARPRLDARSSAPSPLTRRAGRGSSWRAGWPFAGSRPMSFSPRACPSTVERDERSPMASMPNCCCARSSPGSGASRACARWCRCPTRPMRMPAVVFARGPNSCPSAPALSTGSVPSWRHWG